MSLFTVLATSKVAAGVLAAGTLAVGGTGVAAVSGALPAEAQQTAHELLGAPAPKLAGEAAAEAAGTAAGSADVAADAAADVSADSSAEAAVSGDEVAAEANVSAAAGTAVDAAGAAAFGLCTAFTNGGLNASSEGFSSLVIAAEGEANIEPSAPTSWPRVLLPPTPLPPLRVPPPSRPSAPNCPQSPLSRPFRVSTASLQFPLFLQFRRSGSCRAVPGDVVDVPAVSGR